ncbi:MAG: ATP-binding protein [Chloroflexi bacterium]|nr:ATP-binding protein [Chloroflexota bacterium]
MVLIDSEREQRRLADENAASAAIGRIISSSINLNDVYDAFTEEVRGLVRFDWIFVSIVNLDTGLRRTDYVSGPSVSNIRKGNVTQLNGTFNGAVVQHRDCLVENFGDRDDTIKKSPILGAFAEAGFKSVLGVPLFSREKMIGTLLFMSAEEVPYSEGEITVARNVAAQIAGAMANAQTYAELLQAQTQLLRAHDERENRVLDRTEELEKTRDIALEATKAKSQFLEKMSHELRTPLNAVIGYSELLIDKAKDDDNTAIIPDLERMTASGNHLMMLVSDVLDLAKVEAGKMELSIEDFDISSAVDEVRIVSQPLARANNNSLAIVYPDDIGSMRTDQIKMRQMLFNLLSNASKFTEDGNIYLNVARQFRDGTDWIVFTVTDTGIGIKPEVVRKLFQPFTQADSPTARKYGGSGLGLSLCRTFTEMMGGTITVNSLFGSGSTFVIAVPATVTGPAADPTGQQVQQM